MRRFLSFLSITLICLAIAVQPLSAQGRHNGSRENRTTQNTHKSERSNKHYDRTNSSKKRPGATNERQDKNRGKNNNHFDKQHNGGDKINHTDGNKGNRPDINKNKRPNNGVVNRPPTPRRDNGHRPGVNGYRRPGPGLNHPQRPPRPAVVAPPRRPGRPIMRPFQRPTPPPAWRPGPKVPIFKTILGISFGATLSISLDHLFDNGYIVDGYNNEAVYLRNVQQMNYYWPDATLYYAPGGGLIGSEFIYSTGVYDMSRYNSLFGMLSQLYGHPAYLNQNDGELSATWFGNGTYIRLEYQPMASIGGPIRYFTTLSFGN